MIIFYEYFVIIYNNSDQKYVFNILMFASPSDEINHIGLCPRFLSLSPDLAKINALKPNLEPYIETTRKSYGFSVI